MKDFFQTIVLVGCSLLAAAQAGKAGIRGLVPYLIEAIKTQQQTIELLQSRLAMLENNNM